MSDQLPLANVLRVEAYSRGDRGDWWIARIGPRGRGLQAIAGTPERALRSLLDAIEQTWCWPWDESWSDTLTGE